MSLVSDDERFQSIVGMTAEFRYRICWKGAHLLLRERGIDPMQVLQLRCDQGFDVNTILVLPDGTIVDVDFKENPKTRELVAVGAWTVVEAADRYDEIGREIVGRADTTEFDRLVQQDWELHWQGKDAPLPTIGSYHPMPEHPSLPPKEVQASKPRRPFRALFRAVSVFFVVLGFVVVAAALYRLITEGEPPIAPHFVFSVLFFVLGRAAWKWGR